jgi:hypothetical protein
MKINIYRRPKPVSLDLIKEALQFYARSLMNKRLYNKLAVRVVFVKNMVDKQGLEGSCTWEDDNIRPREFSIHIDNKLSEDEVLKCLAHEMVHVKQWAKMEMRQFMRKSDVHWLGKPVDDSVLSYSELPWEKEAWGLEDKLVESFKETKDAKTEQEKPSS